MIIDAILDAKENNNLLDLDGQKYIYDEAMIFNFQNLSKALDEGNEQEIKKALKVYIIENDYNNDLIKDIDNLKIEL